jgi:hypothetical protein
VSGYHLLSAANELGRFGAVGGAGARILGAAFQSASNSTEEGPNPNSASSSERSMSSRFARGALRSMDFGREKMERPDLQYMSESGASGMTDFTSA